MTVDNRHTRSEASKHQLTLSCPLPDRAPTIAIMNSNEQTAIAVIADAHCHDMDSDYGLKRTPLAGQAATLRSWQDSRRSSRLFNESTSALLSALEDIRRRGIRHVVLLGDYTDDGQTEATARLRTRLLDYRQRYDMAFYAIPGNHDCYGPHGKHQSTRFVTVPGESVLVTSDPTYAATEENAVLTSAMYCQGTPRALQSMAEFGLFPQAEHLHWETPFGHAGDIGARQYTALSADGQVSRSLTDASYLVEPVTGLWLLMIDANVFEPRNGQWRETQKKAFLDSSDGGWNSVLRNRPHLLPWIEDVSRRAAAQGKQLLGFSHYPAMDPFDDHSDIEGRLFGQTDMRRRRPSEEVAKALLGAGLQLHFGGHLHVNGYRHLQLEDRQLSDVAVPSTATFPAAYQIIHISHENDLKHDLKHDQQPGHRPSQQTSHTFDHENVRLETVPLNDMPLNPDLLDYYRKEIRAMGAEPDQALSATHYGEFLYQRMHCRVVAHYLPRQWPPDMADAVQRSNAAELATFLLAQQRSGQVLHYASLETIPRSAATVELQRLCEQHPLPLAELEACTLMHLLVDWYGLRQAGHQACSFFKPRHLPVYHFLAEHFGDLAPPNNETQAAFLQIFLGGLQQFLHGAIPGNSLIMSLPYRQSP